MENNQYEKLFFSRFWSKVSVLKKRQCWEWKSSLSNGYGKISKNNYPISAHVAAFEFFNGKVPNGLWVDHKCRNKKCVNPNHLRAVTPKINAIENSESTAAINSRKTHCKHGHEFNVSNTVIKTYIDRPSTRVCRICRDLRNKNRYIIKRARQALKQTKENEK